MLFPIRAAATFAVVFPLLWVHPALGFQNAQVTPRPIDSAVIQPEGSVPEAHLRVDMSMVLVPLQATRGDAPVMDLRSTDLHVFENGDEQQIRYFVQEDEPASIGLLLDSSASMKGKERKTLEAAAAFFRASNPKDEFFLIKFDESARLELGFTQDSEEVQKEIRHTRPFGRTSLYDAVNLGLDAMKSARYRRRALVILSDGGDNRSRRTFGMIQSRVYESDVAIYALGIFDQNSESSAEDEKGAALLAQLASSTGGAHFAVELADLPRIGETLGRLIRTQYVVGYIPSNAARDGTYRRIRVDSVREGPVLLRHRHGYYAPAH